MIVILREHIRFAQYKLSDQRISGWEGMRDDIPPRAEILRYAQDDNTGFKENV